MKHFQAVHLKKPLAGFSVTVVFLAQTLAAAATVPTGGNFKAGAGVISASGNAVTINQSSLRGVIDWSTFSIGQGGLVKFNNGAGTTLNRVTGGNMSNILGSLIASGSVYLINPQGVLVGPGAHINTGGDFVASSLNIGNTEFIAGGSLLFKGGSASVVANLGDIFSNNGSVFLIGHAVTNNGQVHAANGSVGLAAGSQILIKDSTSDQRISVQAAGGDVTNTGLIAAAQVELKTKGGNIYALAGNNGGQINATGTATINGQTWLVADSGTTNVTGSVSARNANGAGGAVETSGQHVAISGATIKTGRGGTWLLDPDDLTIDAPLAATIETALDGPNPTNVVESTSASGTGGSGDINVNASIAWDTNASLTLSAYRNININNGVTIANLYGHDVNNNPFFNSGNLILRADNAGTGLGSVTFHCGSVVDFSQSVGLVSILYDPIDGGSGKYNSPISYSSHITTNGGYLVPQDSRANQFTAYMLVNNLTDLQNVNTNLSGTYALGSSLDALNMSFTPIGSASTPFTGVFDGFANTISNLSVEPAASYLGLFGQNNGVIRNVGLMNASITEDMLGTSGGLVGNNTGTVFSSFSNGQVNGYIAGGLVGENSGTITNTFAMGTVQGGFSGGLVGTNDLSGIISSSYSTAIASYGLVALNNGSVQNSYWDIDNSGTFISSGGTGLPRSQLQSGQLPIGLNPNVWEIGMQYFSYPYLKSQFPAFTIPVPVTGTVYTDQTQTRGTVNRPVLGISNGVDFGQTVYTGADGYYYFLIPQAVAPTGPTGGLLTYLPNQGGVAFSEYNAQAFYLPITSNYLTLQSREPTLTQVVGNLQLAAGGLINNPNLMFGIASGNILTVNNGTGLNLLTDSGSLVIDQPISVNNLVLEGFPNATQTAAISVNNLTLLGTGNFNLTNPQNTIGTLATAPYRNLPLVEDNIRPSSSPRSFAVRPHTPPQPATISVVAQGDIHLGTTDAAKGVFSTGSATIQASGNLIIDPGIPYVEANGTGVSLTLSDGGSFSNNSLLGASTLSTPNGNWEVWSQNPGNDVRGGIPYNFKQYSATYGITTPAETDNGVLYTTGPVLTPSFGPVTRQYDTTVNAAVDPNSFTLSGVIDNDAVVLNAPGSSTFSNKNVGTNKAITISGLSVTATDGSARVYGYQLPSSVALNVGTITPAPLVAVTAANNKIYDGATAATGTTLLSGVLQGDNVSVGGSPTYSFADKNVGVGKGVTAAGLALAGPDAANYTFSLNSPVADITPAQITATYVASNKVYDGTTAATGSLGALSGIVPGDTVSLNGTATYAFADKNAATGKPVTASRLSLNGSDSSNYTLTLQQAGRTDITPAQLFYSANNGGSRPFGASNGSFSGAVTGLVGGDTLASVATGTPVFTSPAGDSSVAGVYAVNGSGLTLTTGNYTLAQAASNALALTVSPITITVGNLYRNTGAPNPTFTVGYSGSVTPYLQSLLNSLQLVTNAPANDAPGTYQITAVIPAALADSLFVQPGTLTIVSSGAPTPPALLPAQLQNQYPIPPPPITTPASSGTLLLPSNATGIFHIDIRTSQDWGGHFQGGSITDDALSSASFTDSSSDGRTPDHKSTYAAGAHQ